MNITNYLESLTMEQLDLVIYLVELEKSIRQKDATTSEDIEEKETMKNDDRELR